MEGMRVLDLTSIVFGPWATQMMGDMGADVIKVEAPEGDVFRYGGPRRNPGMGGLFLSSNRNKRSIVLDLKSPDGLKALQRLIEDADVFVHSMRPQAVERLGLSYDEVAAINPKIVYCGGYGYRRDGPYGERPAFDDMIQALSGIAMLQKRLLGEPAYVPSVLADKTMSMALFGNVAMALLHRERTGEGQEVETTMFETMTAFTMVEHLFGHAFEPPLASTGYSRVLTANRKPYRTKDGYIGVLPYTDGQWRSFFEATGRADLAEDPRFATVAARLENIDYVYGEIANLMTERNSAEWLEIFEAVHVPANEVNDLDDLLVDPHLEAIGFWQEADHPSEGRVRMSSPPARFSKSPGTIRRLAPRLGEHTSEVLAEAGFAEAEIAALIKSSAARQGD